MNDQIHFLFIIFEIIGTIAFTISGALLAVEKKMDILGVILLGIVTSFGGGILRDIIIGVNPPSIFLKPVYVLISCLVSIIVFIFCYRKVKLPHKTLLLIMDSIGLGIFAALGTNTAFIYGYNSAFIGISLGVITAVGGGVIRDILAGVKPQILVRHFYACAAIIGAIVCFILSKYLNSNIAIIISMAITFTLRMLAAHFHWNLPKISR